jgi:hypothetical protein
MTSQAVHKLREFRDTLKDDPQTLTIVDWFLNGLIEGVYMHGKLLELPDFNLLTLIDVVNGHAFGIMAETNGQPIEYDCFLCFHVRVNFSLPNAPIMQKLGDGTVRPLHMAAYDDFNSWLCKLINLRLWKG